MVAGHTQHKDGYYYSVLSYNDEHGKRKTKWIATGLPEKGNKKKAEEMLINARKQFVVPSKADDEKLLFSDYLLQHWLPMAKNGIELTTYSSYEGTARNIIAPYFREKGTLLKDLKAKDLQDYYTKELERVKAATVLHYHAIIHRALEYAVKMELIMFNPADRVDRPKKQQFIPEYYTTDEINRLFECIRGDTMELLFKMTLFYGMRKSETLGLKWSAIDFESNTFVIRHVVTSTRIDGKKLIIKKDRTKRAASYRTMPLVDMFRRELLEAKKQQDANKKLCRKSYNTKDEDYVFVDTMGSIIDPARVSRHFKAVLKKNQLKEIRFHDTRHSAASALCQNNVNMKAIQEWLGHSDYATTANIYSHLKSDTKISTAETMLESLGLSEHQDKKEASSEDETS